MAREPQPTFFDTPAAFRAWLKKNHARETELWMGYLKRSSGKGGLTYKPALDEALCFGWIDGIVKSVDADSYKQRWTPRKKDSHWSLVNVRRFGELDAEGRIAAPGRAAFERKRPERVGQASYESGPKAFLPEHRERLMKNPTAFAHWKRQPDGYRRVVKHWIRTAKKEETRERRFLQFIAHAEKDKRLPQFVSPPSKKG
jgi:uncharacterized protein YdeI (YjbR/CyaY-like superfamily)